MSVKGIFKVLIGTIVFIVISALIVEIFNVTTTGLQINQIAKLAGKQAAELYSQETYKVHGDSGEAGGAVSAYDIYGANGKIYLRGNFYPAGNPREIYNALYGSADFKDWMKHSEAVRKGNWYNLGLIHKAINNPGALRSENEAIIANIYKDEMMTPLNLGIPYLDKEVVNKMFRWNLTQLFSSCNPEMITDEGDSRVHVKYKGFKIYTDLAVIDRLEYRTYDLKDNADRIEFNRVTSINPDKVQIKMDDNLAAMLRLTDDERSRVCLVGIEYKVPISYEGITPIKNIFNYVWENEVEGINGGSGRTTKLEWQEHAEKLTSGGFDGNTDVDVLPIPGKLVYYVIR